MAPQPPQPPSSKKPSAKALRVQRITGAIHPLAPPKTFRPDAAVTDSFLSNKRDKRLIRHSAFVSKIASSRVTKAQSRRRPSKKLRGADSLDALADALPELQDGEGESGALEGKIRHRSLKSRRGALKKKERVVKGEMERFGASMAKLTSTVEAPKGATSIPAAESNGIREANQQDAPPPATSNRWAALRGYISSTMEQNPAFAPQKPQ